ncbi:MAG: aspartate carbamoyltransferase catalytic subunit [Deltaproteobacteria bacterium]|nr:aspartate carbamoyltransferase catalytic subunit [Deltaproteobacteria bacterium]
MSFNRKHLLSTHDLRLSEIEEILHNAKSFKEVLSREVKKVPTLRGKTILNLFLEDSTRTRTSFEIAGKRLSADVVNISKSGSSVSKGESLLDTAKTLEAMQPDILVVRAKQSGFAFRMAQYLHCSVINGGDGTHEHPTQALLDLFTILEKRGSVKGMKIAIVGDVAHSRVARSNIYLLKTMGAQVSLVGPTSLMPAQVELYGVEVFNELIPGIRDADVIMMLRIQQERLDEVPTFPSLREYSRFYGLDRRKMNECKKEVLILHPGPVNRGVEISPEVADGPHSVILDQVAHGVAVRMALLYLLGK